MIWALGQGNHGGDHRATICRTVVPTVPALRTYPSSQNSSIPFVCFCQIFRTDIELVLIS